MRLIRSWPEHVPEGRAHVVDSIPRFIMRDYDYRGVEEMLRPGDDGLVILEWDMACHPDELRLFLEMCRDEPDRVRVAPYRIWSRTELDDFLPQEQQVWCLRRYTDEGKSAMRFCTPGDTHAHLFGLGLTYIPRDVLLEHAANFPGHFSDGSFSAWHYEYVERETPITWDVRPVHLHYPVREIGA
ncbi:hypothetical protein ACIRON_02750 [Nocardioides sp. NPDC101246]|uniref:hypothetical protein n=1 Tax=Nocardioides sp. NPDC101246 TaxID=3364336 RepID=UPI0038267F80